ILVKPLVVVIMKRQFKLSGEANRKRRKEEEENQVKCRDALRKYLQPREQEPVGAAAEEVKVSLPSSQETLNGSVTEQELDSTAGQATSTLNTINDNAHQLKEMVSTPTDAGDYLIAVPIVPAEWPLELSYKERTELSMHLDVAVDLLKKAEDSLCSYRHTGFVSAQISAKEICEEMNVVAVLKKKRLRTTKRQFS
ncbi:hypothetical protein Pmani_022739, partial [Petrolisthes manimaculis]